jgi:hypothetical protein
VTGVIAIAVLVALVALLGFVGTRPAGASVETAGGFLRVRLHGIDVLLALRRQLDVPRSAVVAVRAAAKQDVPQSGVRVPGTSIPGLVRAGSFGTGARKELWDVRRGSSYLVIDLAPGQRFRRIVLEVDDPVAEAARLQRLLARLDRPEPTEPPTA